MDFEVDVSFFPSFKKLSVAVDPSAHRTFRDWKVQVEASFEKECGTAVEVRVFQRRSTSEILSMDRLVCQELKIIRYVDAHTAWPPLDEIFKLPRGMVEADLGPRLARSWKAHARYFQQPNALAVLAAAGHHEAARELAEEALGGARAPRCRREARGAHRAGLAGSGAGGRGPWGAQRGPAAPQPAPPLPAPPWPPRPGAAPGVAAQAEEAPAPAVAADGGRAEMPKPPARPQVVEEPCTCPACMGAEQHFYSLSDGYVVVSPPLALEDVHLVRESYVSSAWRLDGSTGEFRPPPLLEKAGQPVPNPVMELGACGCPAHHVRPDFVAFCLQHVRAQFAREQPLVYASLGSGALYHDWEVVEELLHSGYAVAEVHVVDTSYKRSLQEAEACKHCRRAGSALRALAAWLAVEGVELRAYDDLESLTTSLRDRAHVLMQCDADCPSQFLEPALVGGGVHLHMSQATGEWLEAWRKPCLPSWFGKRRPRAGELASKHAVLQGLALLERRSGLDDIGVCGLGLARGQRRERAIRAGELWCVVGARFPEASFSDCIGACHQPRLGSAIVRFHPVGEELVIDPKSMTADGWVRLSPMQLDGPVGGSGDPGWVLFEEEPFGRLLERVVHVVVTVSHAVEEQQQAQVTVPSTATVLEVKDALARELRRPEILRRARLVKRRDTERGGHLLAYRDGERLDGQRDVLLLGLDDLKAADGDSVPRMTRYKIWSILREMRAAFSEPAFQRMLRKFDDEPRGGQEFTQHEIGVIVEAQLSIAARYGFERTLAGVEQMNSEVGRFASVDAELAEVGEAVKAALTGRSAADSTF